MMWAMSFLWIIWFILLVLSDFIKNKSATMLLKPKKFKRINLVTPTKVKLANNIVKRNFTTSSSKKTVDPFTAVYIAATSVIPFANIQTFIGSMMYGCAFILGLSVGVITMPVIDYVFSGEFDTEVYDLRDFYWVNHQAIGVFSGQLVLGARALQSAIDSVILSGAANTEFLESIRIGIQGLSEFVDGPSSNSSGSFMSLDYDFAGLFGYLQGFADQMLEYMSVPNYPRAGEHDYITWYDGLDEYDQFYHDIAEDTLEDHWVDLREAGNTLSQILRTIDRYLRDMD